MSQGKVCEGREPMYRGPFSLWLVDNLDDQPRPVKSGQSDNLTLYLTIHQLSAILLTNIPSIMRLPACRLTLYRQVQTSHRTNSLLHLPIPLTSAQLYPSKDRVDNSLKFLFANAFDFLFPLIAFYFNFTSFYF